MISQKETLKEYKEANTLLGSESLYNFMNHGYFPSPEGLQGYHKLFQHQSSLYINLIKNLNTKNKKILDIGCGRGGGVDLYKKYFSFSKVIGLDISPENIQHCKKNIKDIEFVEASALSLPFKNNSFDFITNVESAHCYQDILKFFSEVKRVLKPGGMFLYTDAFYTNLDLAPSYNHVIVEQNLPFKKVIKENITKNVLKSCQKDYQRFNNLIKDKNVKDLFTNIAKSRFIDYGLNNWNYIIYTCYN